MRIQKLSIINYRNYKKKKLNFTKDLNIITGRNGTGKTNILESIFFISTTASHRTRLNTELIKKGEGGFNIKAEIVNRKGTYDIQAKYEKDSGLQLKMNSMPEKSNRIIQRFPVVMFSPEDMEIIKGPPSNMRRMININLAQISPGYINEFVSYKKILKERNMLLKDKEIKKDAKKKMALNTWSDMLKKHSEKIIKCRKRFIDEVNESMSSEIEKMGIEEFKILYNPCKFSQENEKEDIKYGYTTTGPHRDSYDFYKNEEYLKTHGSRGEIRIAALIYRLAMWRLLKKHTDTQPIVLLDDVFSELDEENRIIIKNRVKGVQTIITATRIPEPMSTHTNIITL